jgi:hypothetical protein
VDDAVKDCFSEGAFTDFGVPAGRCELREEDCRAFLVACFNDFEYIPRLALFELVKEPLVEDEKFGPFALVHHFLVSSGTTRHGEIIQQIGVDVYFEVAAGTRF